MLWLSTRELASRRLASALTLLGLLTATLGFTVLSATARSATATFQGDLAKGWEAPYDLLVRPPGSVSSLEQTDGLVRPNLESGIHGGITLAQLQQVREVAGVAVAAPLALAGFVSWPSEIHIPLHAVSQDPNISVYRVTTSSGAQAGLSRYKVERRYVVVAARGELFSRPAPYPASRSIDTLLVHGRTIHCVYPTTCYAPRVCFISCARDVPVDPPGYRLPVLQPIAVAGIDPVAEAQLLHLDRCLSSGRYFDSADRLSTIPEPQLEQIPVLVSNHSYIDESFTMTIDRARSPGQLFTRSGPAALTDWLTMPTQEVSADELYRAFLPRLSGSPGDPYGFGDPYPVWSVGDVSYRRLGPTQVEALTQAPVRNIYGLGEGNRGFGDYPHALLAPPELHDVWFRSITEHVDRYALGDSRYLLKNWVPVGEYDPSCLPGFDQLFTGGGIETFSAPVASLPDGRRLGPTRSMADYVNSPPLVLTTLQGASWLSDGDRYAGQPGSAFISLIRVKVRGIGSPSPATQARLARIAADIHIATGLQVDIVRGSSPTPIAVSLPAGRYGRPALTVTEGWFVKGVVVRFASAVQRQNILLFCALLVAAVLLTTETALTSVRRRRSEFGVLRGLGWPTSRISLLVMLETVQLGLISGVLAVIVVSLMATAGALRLTTGILLLPIVLSPCLAGLASIVPALSASRTSVTRVIRGSGRIRRSRLPRTIWGLGIRELLGAWRWTAVMGASAIAFGSAILGAVVLVQSGFNGQLDATVLGTYLGEHVRGYHVVVGLLTLALGALGAGEVLVLAHLQQRTELAALRALGWPRGAVLRIVGGQAGTMGLLGGAVAIGLTVAFGFSLHARWGAIWAGALAAGVLALAATLIAFAGPAVLAYRTSPAPGLRGE